MLRILQLSVLLAVLALILVQCNILWIPPKSYKPTTNLPLSPPVMSLREYTSSGAIDRHPRPYTYTVEAAAGKTAVYVFGAEHSFDPSHAQFPVMKEQWEQFNPSIALVEGHLDLVLRWFPNTVKASGEGGFVQRMAKKKKIKLYSWEPGRQAEITGMLRKYDKAHIIAFFSLRRHTNQWSNYTQTKQDKMMQKMINEIKKYKGLEGSLSKVAQLDSLWKSDFPNLPSWRAYKHPRNGWPAGTFENIAEETSNIRDEYMCNAIIELVRKGERVFISMGSSHAVRIERTLRQMLK